MKKTMITLIALIALGMTSCKKTETTKPTNNIPESTYCGPWSLVSYNPSPMMGSTFVTNYNVGDIVWNFDSSNQSVTVTINNTVNDNPLNAGTYNYQLSSHACNYNNNQYFTTNDEIGGVLILDDIANNKLRITAECLDGAILKFER